MSKSESSRWIRHTVSADEAGRTVEDLLVDTMRISRRMIQRLTRSRGIELNRRPVFLRRTARVGDVIAARVAAEEEGSLPPVQMELRIPYEDKDLLVVEKPPYLLVHPTSPAHAVTLAHGVAHHLASGAAAVKVHPVHRIDRDTSGLVLFAKAAIAHHRLDLQLRDHSLRREYLAFTEGFVDAESGEIRNPIGPRPGQPSLRAVRDDGEEAVTRFRVVERFDGATLLSLELETGRTHQIRVHLAHLGHPLIGDRPYGGTQIALLRRQALHSARLAFSQPTSGEAIVVESQLPPDLDALREKLRLRSSP